MGWSIQPLEPSKPTSLASGPGIPDLSLNEWYANKLLPIRESRLEIWRASSRENKRMMGRVVVVHVLHGFSEKVVRMKLFDGGPMAYDKTGFGLVGILRHLRNVA